MEKRRQQSFPAIIIQMDMTTLQLQTHGKYKQQKKYEKRRQQFYTYGHDYNERKQRKKKKGKKKERKKKMTSTRKIQKIKGNTKSNESQSKCM